jgi:hypothetical protein
MLTLIVDPPCACLQEEELEEEEEEEQAGKGRSSKGSKGKSSSRSKSKGSSGNKRKKSQFIEEEADEVGICNQEPCMRGVEQQCMMAEVTGAKVSAAAAGAAAV